MSLESGVGSSESGVEQFQKIVLHHKMYNQIILVQIWFLKNLQKEYDIQLVVFEVYDALNFEEIPIKNLTALKMMYPSVSKVIETPERAAFVSSKVLSKSLWFKSFRSATWSEKKCSESV